MELRHRQMEDQKSGLARNQDFAKGEVLNIKLKSVSKLSKLENEINKLV